MYLRLFFFMIYFFFTSLVFIFVIIKFVNFAKSPSLTSFPDGPCEPSEGCARVMVFENNHRDNKVDPNNLFTVTHIGVNNTNDFIKG